jgi:hypothetical protein
VKYNVSIESYDHFIVVLSNSFFLMKLQKTEETVFDEEDGLRKTNLRLHPCLFGRKESQCWLQWIGEDFLLGELLKVPSTELSFTTFFVLKFVSI